MCEVFWPSGVPGVSFLCLYIRTDNYMADLLIARKIDFSFKTCQLGH